MKGEKNSQVNTNRGKLGALFKQILTNPGVVLGYFTNINGRIKDTGITEK